MLWRRKDSGWAIDPANVEFGSVVRGRDENLSRSHVLVCYRDRAGMAYVPLGRFIRETHELLAGSKVLDIDRLRVAPLTWRRNATFFQDLTDWSEAARAALDRGEQRPRRTAAARVSMG